MSSQVALIQHAGLEAEIERISADYRIPVLSDPLNSSYQFHLDCEDGILKLIETGTARYRPIYLRAHNPRRVSRRTLLGRAIGRKARTVADATAGLGGDALLLARMGYAVIAIERQPAVAALLENGVSRVLANAPQLSIEFCFSDAKEKLSKMQESPDVIYLDPMYPAGRKSSVKAARPVRVLRELAGDDEDAESLLDASLSKALNRVVVKRPHFAEPLARDRLTGNVAGKLVRYDIYQPR